MSDKCPKHFWCLPESCGDCPNDDPLPCCDGESKACQENGRCYDTAYAYDPLPCEWCRQEVDTSKGLHECRQVDLLKRIEDLEHTIKTSSDLYEKLVTKQLQSLRAAIQAAIGVIDNWKVPLLDPDGKDSSEAVMRLLADDLRKVLEDE